MPARSCLSADLTLDEAEGVRRGLLTLRQNVVLLRDQEDSNSFYPVGSTRCLHPAAGSSC